MRELTFNEIPRVAGGKSDVLKDNDFNWQGAVVDVVTYGVIGTTLGLLGGGYKGFAYQDPMGIKTPWAYKYIALPMIGMVLGLLGGATVGAAIYGIQEGGGQLFSL